MQERFVMLLRVAVLGLSFMAVNCCASSKYLPSDDWILKPGGTYIQDTLSVVGSGSKTGTTLIVTYYTNSSCLSGQIGQPIEVSGHTMTYVGSRVYSINESAVYNICFSDVGDCRPAIGTVAGITIQAKDVSSSDIFSSPSGCATITSCNGGTCTGNGTQVTATFA
ncbi:MAG: hypothetical protein P1U63_13320 [Coxiellaceae bacterium]|nr:hypothetical protein [Coxiellaceae bacterium]